MVSRGKIGEHQVESAKTKYKFRLKVDSPILSLKNYVIIQKFSLPDRRVRRLGKRAAQR